MRQFQFICLAMIPALVFSLFFVDPVPAGADKPTGWESNSEYNKLYDADAVDRIKAVVLDVIDIVPLPGMSKGVGLKVEDINEGVTYIVHICPQSYKTKRSIGIKKGDKLNLRGCFVEIGGEELIMASKIKFKNKTLKVRLSSDGRPFWTLSPEELKKELME
jgi:hypothetical protein